ncbi:hypothetical protein D3C80_1768870 [compost metagenome]
MDQPRDVVLGFLDTGPDHAANQGEVGGLEQVQLDGAGEEAGQAFLFGLLVSFALFALAFGGGLGSHAALLRSAAMSVS